MTPQPPNDSILASILGLLPSGGMVISMQASFDDSGNSDESLMVVAGYFFRDSAITPFSNEWRALLGGRRFHMVDLVHRKEDFADLSKQEANDLSIGLIATIKRHMTLGAVISVDRNAYNRYIVEDPECRDQIGSPFALCSMLCLASSAKWMEHNGGNPEETVYFFESGNSKQADANAFLNTIKDNPTMDERYKYVSHGFVKKNKLASLDAADLLGWEWTQHCKRVVGTETRPMRASLKSLIEKEHIGEHFQGNEVRIAFAKRLLEPYVMPKYDAHFPSPPEWMPQ